MAFRLQRMRSAISGRLISLPRSSITILLISPSVKYRPCDRNIWHSLPSPHSVRDEYLRNVYLKAGKAIAMTIPTGRIAWVYEEHVETIFIIHLHVVLSIPDFGRNAKT